LKFNQKKLRKPLHELSPLEML